MRFDKDLWKPDSQAYNGATLPAQDVQHLTPAARVFIALWFELLQENRSPETRALRSLAVPDLLSELLNSLRFPDRHGFWGRFVKSLQNTAFRRFSVAFHGLGNGRRLC